MHGCTKRLALGCAALLLSSCVAGDHRRDLPQPRPVRHSNNLPPRSNSPFNPTPRSARPAPRPDPPREIARLVRPPGGIQSTKWRYVVVHHSATKKGNAKSFHEGHKNLGWNNGLGYHFVIGNGRGAADGLIEVGPRWVRQQTGAHCNSGDNRYNEHGIGICLVGNFEIDRPTARQMASLEQLIRYLRGTCHIPLAQVQVHGNLKKTLCPGRHFSLPELKRRLLAQDARPQTDGIGADMPRRPAARIAGKH